MPITNQFDQQNLIRRHGNIPKLASTHGSTTTTLDLNAIPYQPQTKRTAYSNSAIKQQKKFSSSTWSFSSLYACSHTAIG
jgi:hypothetical protein